MSRPMITIDGNEAAAYSAYRLNEVIAIYPITPSSPMGELSDAWSSTDQPNLWGTVPQVVEMQSEGGASGAVHGALQAGALTTTFTSSQGLLLMIPNMFKIAGELTSAVIHVAARTVATHALSIFGDHSDVMAARSTGFGMLASNNNQEIMDFALIAQAASLEARIPFMHFFDGFRSSHEVAKVCPLTDDEMRSVLDEDLIRAHRERALSPDHPVIRGTAQNPDVFFQAREAINPYYEKCADIVQKKMDEFAQKVGREYKLFQYVGAPDADRVVLVMGTGAETVEETVNHLNQNGEKVGVLKVHLYRPFSIEHFIEALPESVKTIGVLDRTKEPGATGEPMYQDVISALAEAAVDGLSSFVKQPRVIGGRFGLSSKEFTPAMVKAVFDNLAADKPKNHFTVGIEDDISHTSLDYDESFSIEPDNVVRAMFYGLGADGTVGANKNSVKIIGEDTDNYATGYFVYDSKKAGAVTISHLRFGPKPIRSPYLISSANFIACHQFNFIERFDLLKEAVEGATFLLNSPYGPEEVWDHLPRSLQEEMISKKIKFYVIDGYHVAREAGMGNRINTVMQVCFFALAQVLPKDEAIAAIKTAIEKTYGKKGESVVKKNFEAVDSALANLYEVKVPEKVSSQREKPSVVPERAPDFVKLFTAPIIAGLGDRLPVSAMPADGTFPTSTTQWEKRTIAQDIPVWDPEWCIQCAKCAMVCPHAAIRMKAYEPSALDGAPEGFQSWDWKGKEFPGMKMTIQTAPEDCTGCGLCVEICPAKNKKETRLKAINMTPLMDVIEEEKKNYDFFLDLPEMDRRQVKSDTIKGSQIFQPLFEYSGACAGCGETPYIKLMSQLFGDRMLISNATGCSSIYGGNLPTTPYCQDKNGRGPAWSNSLFEDNAEFGFGFRLSIDQQNLQARHLLESLRSEVGDSLVEEILGADQSDEAGIYDQRERVAALKEKLSHLDRPEAKHLLTIADYLVKKSVWIVGGDGWAYDIGYGGLDHVLASGRNVNILVLDTEVYSNTGGQSSKATPRAAVAKFAAGGKPTGKKDLGMMAMAYGNVYVAQIAMGANDTQTVKAFLEAEHHEGPSLIIAYSHCIAHGIDMSRGMTSQKNAVMCGHWPLYRYDPSRALEGENPLVLDSRDPKISMAEYAYGETRYKMLTKSHPKEAEMLMEKAQADATARWLRYKSLAALTTNGHSESEN
ncbi:MAG: pyruvate:ferredoxin (flavodoxin) oxidoreductase [Candidatus Omnitrophica bacterium]|nr:pyruvate:ferredoxin (flavodoxin) oxidoreductase [Candidatus Omnitrophota bacterium]MCB9782976.1 pyruvate:ferredoxin (flavodoxin) oxidoreductase [Candidatus Omnitrophota bacterium]